MQHSQPQPHPLIVEPVLYITGVPPLLAATDVAQAFETCLPVRPYIFGDGDGGGHGRVEFRTREAGKSGFLPSFSSLSGRISWEPAGPTGVRR